jgi:predicted MFS family arabinose efflux permease
MVVSLLPLAIGSTILNTVPTAHLTNLCNANDRAQALSLLRTCGDVGMLFGASFAGIMASLTSIENTIMCNGGILLSSILYVTYRNYIYGNKDSKTL